MACAGLRCIEKFHQKGELKNSISDSIEKLINLSLGMLTEIT